MAGLLVCAVAVAVDAAARLTMIPRVLASVI